MKSSIIKALDELNKKDIYSLILFVLYKLKDNPEYSILSELIYLLDNDSFIRFLKYFEGQTITVPKISELKSILDSLLFYERKLNSELSDNEIFEQLDIPVAERANMYKTLDVIQNILAEYDFKHE